MFPHKRHVGHRELRPLATMGRVSAALVVSWSAVVCSAQYQVQQDGRLLDANNQLYGGRFNSSVNRPTTPLLSGNLILSGDTRRATYFRGVSPIPGQNAFRASLGTTSLFNFRRDSISVADVTAPPISLAPTPYYDPSRTVPTQDLLRQYPNVQLPNRMWGVRSDQQSDNEPLDLRIDSRIDYSRRSMNEVGPLRAGPSAQLRSSIFGAAEPAADRPLFRTPAEELAQQITDANRGFGDVSRLDRVRRHRDEAGAAADALGRQQPLGTPLDLILHNRPTPLGTPAGGRDVLADPLDEASLRDVPLGPLPAADEPIQPGAAVPDRVVTGTTSVPPRITDPSVLPGYDVFNDMQLALALSRNPGAAWYEEMQTAIQSDPTLADEFYEQASQQSQSFLERMFAAPIKTFAGGGEAMINSEMLKAESLLEIGHYYEAADRYEIAERLDPTNPLPQLGRGHALLAAGDYLTAAVSLIRGLERFPEITRFDIDLHAFFGDGEVIDIRRADIMERLERREDPRLRFLLGYLEYHTGDRDRGLRNLEQAAREDYTGSIISWYPSLLRGEGTMPAPKLPPEVLEEPSRSPSE